jgi:DNA helicase-2/ATP-dependent DNA helicase PcrA
LPAGRFTGTTESNRVSYAKNLVSGIKPRNLKPLNGKAGYKTPQDFTPSDTSKLKQGMKVEHPKFGFGKVTLLDVEGAQRKARVEFENFGEKTLLLSFAKLKIHEEH